MTDKKPRISVQSAKSKGRRGQQFIVKELQTLYPTLEPDDIKSCPMGSTGSDVQLSPAARKLIEYEFEVKSVAKATIWTNYEQAARHAAKSPSKSTPVVVTKVDRKPALATIEWSHLVDLWRRAGVCP